MSMVFMHCVDPQIIFKDWSPLQTIIFLASENGTTRVNEPHILAVRAPINRQLPLEPHPVVGLHVVFPLHSHPGLHRCRHHAPPPPGALPAPPPCPARPHSGRPQHLRGVDLRGNLRRHPPLCRSRDPRHALALGTHQDQHASPVAPLLPPGHAPLRTRLLLVLRLLPLALPPPSPHVLHRPPPQKAHDVHALQPVHSHHHVISLARVLPVFPGPGNTSDHSALHRGLWVPLLDGDGVAQSALSFRGKLPGGVACLQLGLPFCGAFVALVQRWVQRHWGLGLQFRAKWSDFVVILEGFVAFRESSLGLKRPLLLLPTNHIGHRGAGDPVRYPPSLES
ncbi:hypothetical protein FH972_018446 [Carpinus fangiana]|uniref:Uncharacterized protein n=1 Tax=Carpinus fangiana TaxID=176857 RepID=A0A5N6RQJ6_9ROSI|nr:hypothetical protein FH972_018446 [Carpinus fangiana]